MEVLSIIKMINHKLVNKKWNEIIKTTRKYRVFRYSTTVNGREYSGLECECESDNKHILCNQQANQHIKADESIEIYITEDVSLYTNIKNYINKPYIGNKQLLFKGLCPEIACAQNVPDSDARKSIITARIIAYILNTVDVEETKKIIKDSMVEVESVYDVFKIPYEGPEHSTESEYSCLTGLRNGKAIKHLIAISKKERYTYIDESSYYLYMENIIPNVTAEDLVQIEKIKKRYLDNIRESVRQNIYPIFANIDETIRKRRIGLLLENTKPITINEYKQLKNDINTNKILEKELSRGLQKQVVIQSRPIESW